MKNAVGPWQPRVEKSSKLMVRVLSAGFTRFDKLKALSALKMTGFLCSICRRTTITRAGQLMGSP